MSMRLLYITKDPAVGQVAQQAGVDWIFVDMEYLGKKDRQANRDTVISAHSLEDVRAMREVITTSQLMVRINPMGAWATTKSPACWMRAQTSSCCRTSRRPPRCPPSSPGRWPGQDLPSSGDISGHRGVGRDPSHPRIDFVHIGLNDLHIERGTTFMFEFLADGGVDLIAAKLRAAGITFGFGGMARIGGLLPPAEHILAEHFRPGLDRRYLVPQLLPPLSGHRHRSLRGHVQGRSGEGP